MSSTPLGPNGQQAAVSLTYDDGLECHADLVAPRLEAHGLLGTFYSPFPGPGVSDPMRRPDKWKAMAANGHELGNHSLFHPCRRKESFGWLKPCYDLRTYSADQLRNELGVANFILQQLDGRSVRSYGNTCHDTTIGDGADETSMEPVLRELFGAVRGAGNQRTIIPGPDTDWYDLGCCGGDFKTAAELRAKVEEAREQGGWLIFCIHGVGAETNRLHIDADEHEQFLQWLGENRDTIWSAPVIDVAGHLKPR